MKWETYGKNKFEKKRKWTQISCLWHKPNCSSENSYLIYCIVTSVNIFLSVKKSRFHIFLCHLLQSNKILNIQIIMTDNAIEFSTALTGNIVQQKSWLRVNNISVVTWRKIYIFNFINCYINCCKKKEYHPIQLTSNLKLSLPLKNILTSLWNLSSHEKLKLCSPVFWNFSLSI